MYTNTFCSQFIENLWCKEFDYLHNDTHSHLMIMFLNCATLKTWLYPHLFALFYHQILSHIHQFFLHFCYFWHQNSVLLYCET